MILKSKLFLKVPIGLCKKDKKSYDIIMIIDGDNYYYVLMDTDNWKYVEKYDSVREIKCDEFISVPLPLK